MQVSELRALVQRAKGKCPDLAGRVDKAIVIVVAREIAPVANVAGQWFVQSEQDDERRYWVHMGAGPKACDCLDFQLQRAPGGWCKHLIAVAMLNVAEEQRLAREHQAAHVHVAVAHAASNGIAVFA